MPGAVDAGADLLGFNFYLPSPRLSDRLSARRSSGVAQPGRRRRLVGVFVNAAVGEIPGVLELCRLDLAQLHGDEARPSVAALGERAFKACGRPMRRRCKRAWCATPCAAAAPGLADRCLPRGPYGGTGQTADWSLAAGLARRSRSCWPVGLRPGTWPRPWPRSVPGAWTWPPGSNPRPG